MERKLYTVDRQQLLKEERDLSFKLIYFLSLRNRNPRKYGTDDLLYTAEADMVGVIGDNENISASDIAKMLNITKSAVSKTINKLSKKDIIEQITDKNDSRKMLLVLTPKGRIIYSTHNSIDDATDNYISSALSDCTDDEIRAYVKIANIHVKAAYEIIGTND